ncbi:hypothetical protein IAQ61_007039, partial [Plenodomus lingam]|uniref:uncharacterized protein n=1 Tax=Leptosphaeria maculans TaxID=5022 RepID=UPI00332F13AB
MSFACDCACSAYSRYQVSKTASGKDEDPTSAAFSSQIRAACWVAHQGESTIGFNMSAFSSYNTCLAEHFDVRLLIRATSSPGRDFLNMTQDIHWSGEVAVTRHAMHMILSGDPKRTRKHTVSSRIPITILAPTISSVQPHATQHKLSISPNLHNIIYRPLNRFMDDRAIFQYFQ